MNPFNNEILIGTSENTPHHNDQILANGYTSGDNMDTDTNSEPTFSNILTDILGPKLYPAPKEQDVECPDNLKGTLLDQEEGFIEKTGSIQKE